MPRLGKIIVCFVFIFSVVNIFFIISAQAQAEENEFILTPDQPYIFEEPIGDKISVNNLTEYLVLVYNYALSLIGILAAVAVIFGGARWAMSAGNESAITAAKETIFGAIIGLVIAVGSYTILNFINPQLTTVKGANIMKIPILQGESTCSWKMTSEVGPGYNRAEDVNCTGENPTLIMTEYDEPYFCYCQSTGSCAVATSGPCSVANLATTCFGANAAMASAICNAESGGDPTIGSDCQTRSCTDKCSNDPSTRAFSFGLFQINIRANPLLLASGGTLDCRSNYTNYANNFATNGTFNCTIASDSRWTECMTAATTAENNIKTACQLSSNGSHWHDWSTNTKCGFPN